MSEMEQLKLILYWLKETTLDVVAAWLYIWTIATLAYMIVEGM